MAATLRKSLKTIEDYKVNDSSLYGSSGYLGGNSDSAGRIPQKHDQLLFFQWKKN